MASEWVCIEHEEGGFAWRKAQQWWEQNVGTPFPMDVNDAVDLLNLGYMKPVVAIEIEKDGKYERVVKIHHGVRTDEDTDPLPVSASTWSDDEDLPF